MEEQEKPQFAEILDWLEGRLPEEAARGMQARLASAGEQVEQDLAWLKDFYQASRLLKTPALPKHIHQALIEQFREQAGRSQSAPGSGLRELYRRIEAVLAFDSHSQWSAVGIRSAGLDDRQRHLVYDTGQIEIALNIQPRSQQNRFNLIGQIFIKTGWPESGSPFEDYSIQIIKAQEEAGFIQVDELGEFIFEDLSGGLYEIAVSTGDTEVVLPAVEL